MNVKTAPVSVLSPDQIRQIKWNADMATCSLNMVSIHIGTKKGAVTVYAMPWDCFEVVATLRTTLDPDWIGLFHAGIRSPWMWTRPSKKARLSAP